MRRSHAALLAALFVAACSSDAMKTEDIAKVQADCSNVDQQIAMLEQEKMDNNKRGQAGVQSILPVTALYNMVSGTYGQNVSIATGEWAEKIDAKLVELRQLKKRCDVQRQGY